MTIQRSSSWAINYKDVCLSHNHSYTRRQSESTQVSAPMQACVQKSNLDQILIKIFALQWDELRLYCDKMSNSSNWCLHWVELWGEQLFKTLHPWFASTDSNFCAHRHFIVSAPAILSHQQAHAKLSLSGKSSPFTAPVIASVENLQFKHISAELCDLIYSRSIWEISAQYQSGRDCISKHVAS